MASHNTPSLLKIALEGRAVPELWLSSLALPLLQTAPKGDGHPVMVLPGFMASDKSTLPMRLFLRGRGYKTYGWGQGRNYGRGIDPNEGVTKDTNIYHKLRHLQAKHGQKLSLIGWSLGGIYARELARIAPDSIRQVITLGSPFNEGQRANHAQQLFERMSGKKIDQLAPELIAKIQSPPPVPATAIYTRSDGVVAWQSCMEQKHPFTENIEVEGSHIGLGHNTAVLWVIADRLAQAAGTWKPFERNGVSKAITYDAKRKTFY